jgi:hypothetical protein
MEKRSRAFLVLEIQSLLFAISAILSIAMILIWYRGIDNDILWQVMKYALVLSLAGIYTSIFIISRFSRFADSLRFSNNDRRRIISRRVLKGNIQKLVYQALEAGLYINKYKWDYENNLQFCELKKYYFGSHYVSITFEKLSYKTCENDHYAVTSEAAIFTFLGWDEDIDLVQKEQKV